MQSQLILNYALQAVFCGFVIIMLFDFIDGIFCKYKEIQFAHSVTYLLQPLETPLPTTPAPSPLPQYCPCEISDPWAEEVEITPIIVAETQAPLPKLYLLPPAKSQSSQQTPDKPQSRQSLLRKIEQLVGTLAWDDFRAYLVAHKLGAKGKKAVLVRSLLSYCKTRTDEQLKGMVQELQAQARRVA